MPFAVGDVLYFTQSHGKLTFTIPRSPTAIRLAMPEQVVVFQPWSLARLQNGLVTPIYVTGVESASPSQVFCNPVVVGGVISFVYGGSLYKANVGEGTLQAIHVMDNVGSGFCSGADIVTSTKTSDGVGRLNINGVDTIFNCPEIIRVIPYDEGYVVTCRVGATHKSYRIFNTGDVSRITVLGDDIYKCCIQEDLLVYAKKEGDFEDRFLYKDIFELTPV